MKTFADWLKYYDNLDVEPFLGALESMQGFYTRLGIDIFKDAVSLPGFQWKMCCWAHWTTETPRSCMPQARRPTKCSKEWLSGDRAWSFVESMRQAKLESVHTNSHAQPTKSGWRPFSRKKMLYSPLLKWYLDHGLKIRAVHRTVDYVPQKAFKRFVEKVTENRRKVDQNTELALLAEVFKLLGNSAYGKLT